MRVDPKHRPEKLLIQLAVCANSNKKRFVFTFRNIMSSPISAKTNGTGLSAAQSKDGYTGWGDTVRFQNGPVLLENVLFGSWAIWRIVYRIAYEKCFS